MRFQTKQRVWAAVATAIMATGCDALWLDVTGDCKRMLTCDYFVRAGSGGGTPPSCVPSENAEAVGDACGVFVSASGNDDAVGTKADPVKTLSVAMARAAAEQGSAVYACAEEFAEAAEVPAGMSIFGGLDCAKGWRWIGETARTVVTPGEEAIALKVMQGEGTVRIEDVSVYAANAQTPGASSIAVLVDGAEAELVRCELVAGNGADGAEGEDAPSEMPAQAAPGNAGANACSDLDTSGAPDETLPGGAQVESVCGGDALSIGGEGGDGRVNNGGDGATSQSIAETARGGVGETVAGTWDCAGDEPNGRGDDGVSGSSGQAGPAASGLGMLSSSGYAGVSGETGKAGQPGQGGGGGGGAKGGAAICPGGVRGAGASGGSGGPGGCGGLPGQGGGAGGASIALASLEGKVTLKDCVLKAGNGGKGGAGGDLQPGGLGGLGGVGGTGMGGSKAACDGGKGGQGGNGGPGGGGLGGPSLAIAYRGEAVRQEGQTMLMPGTAGAGGPGGSSNVEENAGAEGISAAEQKFP
ncbi:PGRS family protein [Sorangium sp. So ce385]|uniref:PGRS family protein n=1 Tax=Sorangium sp. So ce385 TaxID=3133308 RepID=UPI003F5C5B16